MTISYEDLCDDLEGNLQAICRFIGIEPQPGLDRFWEKWHHPLSGNPKPVALIQLHHGLKTMDQLHPDIRDFVERIGFSVKLDARHKERLADSEKRTFRRFGGWVDRGNGYRTDLTPMDEMVGRSAYRATRIWWTVSGLAGKIWRNLPTLHRRLLSKAGFVRRG